MYTRVSIIIAFLLIVTFSIGCEQSNSRKNNEDFEATNSTIDNRLFALDSEKNTVLVYFASEDGKYLVPITRPINPTEELAEVSIETVLGGPGDWFLSNTTPAGTRLRGIHISRNVAHIDLTNHFKNLERICRY